MFHSSMSRASISLVAMFGATTALADLTADDVWSDWKSYMESSGYQIEITEQRSGDTLTIAEIVMELPLPEGEGDVIVTLGDIALTEQGDGTVSVRYPDVMPISIRASETGEDDEVLVNLTQSGQSLTVSGEPNDLTMAFAASEMRIELARVTVAGEVVPPDVARVNLTMGPIALTSKVARDALRSVQQQMTIGTFSYDLAFADPETTDRGSLVGQMSNMSFTGGGDIPFEMDPEDFAQNLKDGLSMSGAFTYENGSSKVEGTDGSTNFSMESSSTGGSFGVSLDATQVSYDLSGRGAKTNISTSEFPFPISLDMVAAGLKFAFPLAQSDGEQDFSFGLNLTDFQMADALWGLFDPGGVLPRDPATIDVDLTGTARVLADIFDPSFPDNFQGPPAEVFSANLNNLLVSMVGARLSGSGAFTFDNTDLETFDGIPRPEGTIDLQLSGGNALLDNLTSMGLIGQQEVLGARVGMAMVGVPGSEPDTLNSKIEINSQGHVLANGQRIQ